MASVPGYSYEVFCAGIAERDGAECYVRRLLVARREAQIEAWGSGQGEAGDPRRNWIPAKLLDCDGPRLDGHHWLSKSWLKREFPHGLRIDNPPEDPEAEFALWPLFEILNDSRNGAACCRRHHDLLERHLIVIRREDLPESVEEFAAELGDRALARLERDFGLRTEAA